MHNQTTVVIGAGPAGLTAAYELAREGIPTTVLEKSHQVGGIARTETYRGYRFDIGGHRFYTKVKEVQDLWQEVLGKDLMRVSRLSRIYYQGKYYNYPLSLFNTLGNLGLFPSLAILFSYLKAQIRIKLRSGPKPESFEEWVSDRFGERLYHTFFKSYTEKVWGIPCSSIRADWAAQRIKGLSLTKAVFNALFGSNDTKTLIKEFDYPVLGPGMMWEQFRTKLEAKGVPVQLNTSVTRIEHDGRRIKQLWVHNGEQMINLSADHFVSSMPISQLIVGLEPPPPAPVLTAAKGLKYRDFLIVALIIDQTEVFPDNWLYIHSPEFRVGRIQNYKNWSVHMVPEPSKTCLGMEYFCCEGDDLWSMSNAELIELASVEVVNLGLVAKNSMIEDGVVVRQHKAYPVYDIDYRHHLRVIQEYLSTFENLHTIGRNGMHRYNNQDHSMLTGLLAARNILGAEHDLWEVNTERSYYEDFTTDKPKLSEQFLSGSSSE